MADSKDNPPLRNEVLKLLAQLLVITLGGAAITFIFQYLGEKRDERTQQASFERQNFLDLHRDLNLLIADRVIVTDCVKARLASGDYAGALELRRSEYDRAVAAWNQNVDRLLRALVKLNACQPAKVTLWKGCNETLPSPVNDCVINYYYDIPWDEKRIDKSGNVCSPRSVHFAFRNASRKLGELLNSDWADCLQLTQALVNREKEDCSAKPLAEYNKEAIAEIASCIDKVKEVKKSGLEICNSKEGYRLNSQLADDLKYVRGRWTALDDWLRQIEQKFGPKTPATAKTAAAKPAPPITR
ncbi:MAG: hypothetical protein ACRECF_06185 [Methyloceanibacter sp.]